MATLFDIGRDHMTVTSLLEISRGERRIRFSNETLQSIKDSNEAVIKIANVEASVYGINTGFGPLCTTRISTQETAVLQEKLLLSHSVGVGDSIGPELARLMLILKLHALCKSYSGVSLEIINRIHWHIENDIIPVVPSQGSVGASGDLAPLAHLFLPLIGRGFVYVNGGIKSAEEVLQSFGLERVNLGPKDILSLINGTQFIAAHTALLVEKTWCNLQHADLIGAMMLDALKGSRKPFLPELHQLRPFPANVHTAARIYSFLKDSEINSSHANCQKVQDPYSLRCMPQVHGASRNSWRHLKENLEIEMNAVTDNPIIFNEHHTISGGNFHGQPLALPIDYACLANAELGSISDRRMYLSLEGKTDGVPKLLLKKTGLNSGFMILQYTAAALASENKTHCFPASADSITTSLGQEDHVSMGSIGARKALKVAKNTEKILAIELICAAQAIEFHRPLRSSQLIESLHEKVRSRIKFCHEDRLFAEDISQAIELLKSGELIKIEKEHKDEYYSDFDPVFEVY
ncbi:histidine ammonia-lyase [Portibacter marinus]|uniref:histidine ammonia-lyase n=1 Tax=Portibacter marinus TaxID=2898660 RepID=UPI001F21FAEC|nr:histidine ammonia-lyase [Portibacter marinus]